MGTFNFRIGLVRTNGQPMAFGLSNWASSFPLAIGFSKVGDQFSAKTSQACWVFIKNPIRPKQFPKRAWQLVHFPKLNSLGFGHWQFHLSFQSPFLSNFFPFAKQGQVQANFPISNFSKF